MDRAVDGRQEPCGPLSSDHTALKPDATSNALSSLYIRPDELPSTSEEHRKAHNEKLKSNHSPDHTNRKNLQITEPLDTDAEPRISTPSIMSSKNKGASQQQYQLKSTESPADQAKALSQNNKDQLISSLRTHKVNTITELRRIEKIFAYLDSEEVTEPMTSAWAHYVNSNNLLSELRGLTKRIPFSSECVDEAKALVVADPASVRSWNFCWLVLVKIEKDNLILKHARALASKRSTWGDRQPTADDARKFISATVAEWTSALRQLLKRWDSAPSTTGN